MLAGAVELLLPNRLVLVDVFVVEEGPKLNLGASGFDEDCVVLLFF